MRPNVHTIFMKRFEAISLKRDDAKQTQVIVYIFPPGLPIAVYVARTTELLVAEDPMPFPEEVVNFASGWNR